MASVTTPEAAEFDDWYEAISASEHWDGLVRQWLDLPETVESSGYLGGSGLREIGHLLALAPGQHLVEVGCGRAGYGLALIADSGARLTGVDFSATALRSAASAAERAGATERTQFRRGDLSGSGLPTGSADAVLSVDAIHFAASVPAAAAECRRLLRTGGALVVTSWEPSSADAVPRLPARLARLDLRRDLLDAGFVDVSVTRRPEWHALEVAFWRQASALDPGDDPALVGLRDEAREFLPLADSLTRVLALARR